MKRITRYSAVCIMEVLEDLVEKPRSYSDNCVAAIVKTMEYLMHYHLHVPLGGEFVGKSQSGGRTHGKGEANSGTNETQR